MMSKKRGSQERKVGERLISPFSSSCHNAEDYLERVRHVPRAYRSGTYFTLPYVWLTKPKII